jgi:pimeloyl-ACP methyl ester carboxylesterase
VSVLDETPSTTETRALSLRLDGATLSYEEHPGVGPTIVGLHGMSSSRASEDRSGYFDWSALSASGRRIVRYDARGHGRSTGRDVPDDYTWPRLADDLLALLDVVSPDEPVDAYGASMGASTLLYAVLKRPDRFRRLALVIPPTAWDTRAAQGANYRQLAALVRERGLGAFVAVAATMPPLPILAAGGWTGGDPDVQESLAPAVMLGAASTDLPDPVDLSGIRQPVLLRPWTDDPGHPVSTAERLHELLPDSVLEVQRTPEDLRGLGARLVSFFS